jgi:[NiFe] hydrogenase diaphorase moiety large subunit
VPARDAANHDADRLARVDAILDRHGCDRTHLIEILREAQEPEGWLPPPVITRIAQRVDLPRARVEGVAGFYTMLHLTPAGRYRIRFSDNITDRMQGSEALLDRMCQSLWVERGRTSEDGLVSIDTTSCIGMGDQGPAMLVNGRAIPHLSAARVDQIAELVRAQTPAEVWPPELFVVEDNVRRSDRILDASFAPGAAIRATIERGAGPALEEIKISNLLGRGGAGFTTGIKWQTTRDSPGDERYVVCNADEGEPGTFKDRVLLARQADLVLEGMTACAHMIGARRGFIYLRGEYLHLREPLLDVLAQRRAAGLLGRDILDVAGFDFDVELRMGAGAYVCGEATALLESLEGKRGIPRNKPPRMAEKGFLKRPTTVNNVETFCGAALIMVHGAHWFRAVGTTKSSGTKLISVSGDCTRPGIYEYPLGVTVQQVLEDCWAERTQAVQVGGPSGTCVSANEFRRRLAFEDLETGGAFIVFDESRDMFQVARHFAHFFAHESCGFCTPCRVGTALLRNCMDKLAEGKGSQHDLDRILRLNRLLKASSHCGLGQSACNPLVDTLKRFRPAYERRLQSFEFEPAFDLDGALARARRMTGRDDPGAHLRETEAG